MPAAALPSSLLLTTVSSYVGQPNNCHSCLGEFFPSPKDYHLFFFLEPHCHP